MQQQHFDSDDKQKSLKRKPNKVSVRRLKQRDELVKIKVYLIYIALVFVFLFELIMSVYLNNYIHIVESQCRHPHNVRRKRDSALLENSVSTTGEASVEFFNPKLRSELEEKENNKPLSNNGKRPSASSSPTGTPQEGENPTNPWVWLTSYSRIPLVAIQGFCSATKDYCPPGPVGPVGPPGSPGQRGDPGVKGERGERGFPGDPGPRGLTGAPGDPGPRGPRGDAGGPGVPGLDGRDGVPGEPGLDGIPGRNGLDGIPGSNGLPGKDGIPGTPGVDGKDGTPGNIGPPGPPGPQGPRGLTGPRGRAGKPGLDGKPGTPGVRAWEVIVNGNRTNEILIPPSIVGSDAIFSSGPIIVKEGDNVRLRCAASGNPRPTVQWRKLDTSTVSLGSWQESSVVSPVLNITHINRDHMGTYMCIADNGIPPAANQTFLLEVHFSPLIRIQNQHVVVTNDSEARLQCEVESFPEAVKYWKKDDKILLENSEKYRIGNKDSFHKYKSIMYLNITKINSSDIGNYQCVAKNEVSTTTGVFTLFATPPSMHKTGQGVAVFGPAPPAKVDLNDLCPPPVQCEKCSDPKEYRCKEGIYFLYDLLGHRDLEVTQLVTNLTYPGLPNRTLDCQMYAVGKPVFHHSSNETYGSWMRDPHPRSELGNETVWITREHEHNALYEFVNKTTFTQDKPSTRYHLPLSFSGNTHVVYNGSFYYNQRDEPYVVRYDLLSRITKIKKLPLAVTNNTNMLYTVGYNYMDFSTDDNGLWVIYGLLGHNNTVVVKLDTNTLDIQYAWNISLKHQKAGEMFIVCGVLYVVDSVMDRNTKIRFALDLYKNLLLEDVSIEFTNPFRRTTMIGYNHRNKELYTWDKGNQLTYPIRYHEIGYNTSKEDKGEPEANALNQTGFDINMNDN